LSAPPTGEIFLQLRPFLLCNKYSDRLDAPIVLVKLRGYKVHLATQHFEALIDISMSVLEFLFALYPYLQAEIIRHTVTSFFGMKKGAHILSAFNILFSLSNFLC